IDPYRLVESYYIQRGFFDAITSRAPDTLFNPNIKPEIVKSQEYGLDVRFLNNRIGLDVAYYKKNAFNQIIYLKVQSPTGYNIKILNAGNLQNQGVELTLNAGIIRSTN